MRISSFCVEAGVCGCLLLTFLHLQYTIPYTNTYTYIHDMMPLRIPWYAIYHGFVHKSGLPKVRPTKVVEMRFLALVSIEFRQQMKFTSLHLSITFFEFFVILFQFFFKLSLFYKILKF